MKSLTLVSTATLCLAVLGCSTAANAPTDEAGGETSSAGSGSGETAGSSTDVSGGSGGASGTSGTTSSAAGTTSSSGGSNAGAGGSVESGGSTSNGGTSTGGSTAGGTAGNSAGGGAAGGGAIDPTTFSGGWDGALIEYACGNTGSGYDCQQPAIAQCTSVIGTNTPPSVLKPTNGAATFWTVGGESSTVYNVTVHIRGVVEVTYYFGGTRDEGTTSILKNLDLFQQGGTVQTNSMGSSFDYNTYEVDVTPAVSGAANTYYLNSVTASEGPHASNSPTTHLTFPIDYTKTIKVMGGGTVRLSVTDSNCTEVQNCGPTSGNTCASPRTVSLTGSTPAAPSSFVQPYQQPATRYGQWLFFDVTNVTVAQ